MGIVRDYNDELDGYVYLPRMFDKARATLAGDTSVPQFGCPLDHTCMARLGVYPEDVLELARVHGDDAAILTGLKEHGIPSAGDCRFDARATEDELMAGVYLRVRPLEHIDELEPRDGDTVVVVRQGEMKVSLGDRQMRIVRSGEAVRIPPELPYAIERR